MDSRLLHSPDSASHRGDSGYRSISVGDVVANRVVAMRGFAEMFIEYAPFSGVIQQWCDEGLNMLDGLYTIVQTSEDLLSPPISLIEFVAHVP
jgi:hypothetical protein